MVVQPSCTKQEDKAEQQLVFFPTSTYISWQIPSAKMNLCVPTASYIQEFHYTSPLGDYVHLNSNEDVLHSHLLLIQYTFSASSRHRKEESSLEFLFGPK